MLDQTKIYDCGLRKNALFARHIVFVHKRVMNDFSLLLVNLMTCLSYNR